AAPRSARRATRRGGPTRPRFAHRAIPPRRPPEPRLGARPAAPRRRARRPASRMRARRKRESGRLSSELPKTRKSVRRSLRDASSRVHHESRAPLRYSPAVHRQPKLVLELADQRSRIALRTEMLDRLQRVGGVQYAVGHPACRLRRVDLHEDIRADVTGDPIPRPRSIRFDDLVLAAERLAVRPAQQGVAREQRGESLVVLTIVRRDGFENEARTGMLDQRAILLAHSRLR